MLMSITNTGEILFTDLGTNNNAKEHLVTDSYNKLFMTDSINNQLLEIEVIDNIETPLLIIHMPDETGQCTSCDLYFEKQ